jgi:putative zinc- or iron-chelating protein
MTAPQSPLAVETVDEIWRQAAAAVGFRVERTRDAYATSDGRGVIAIGAGETLDDDDAFGQLVFHELCHAVTEGEGALARPDWGLDNVDAHVVREHACLRLQAALADRFGLRAAMQPTTVYRAYYLALPADPLAGADPAAAIAASAVARFDASSWRAPVEQALAASAVLGRLPGSTHPLGFPMGPAGETCGSCAWLYVGGRGGPVPRCRQSAGAIGDGARTLPEHPACARWERPVDCRTCGACCREAYHSVTISVRDPVVWQEPDLIVRHGHRFEIRREGPRCAALEVTAAQAPAPTRYGCTIYDHRPHACREFAAGGRHCLDARRRVGLSARGSAA